MALTTPITPTLPEHEIRQIEDQITELAAHIHAANYRLLTLIRRFDDSAGWSGPGLRSCAHWLNWKCGIGMNAAREKVRVAHALGELPKISGSFSKGGDQLFNLPSAWRVRSETYSGAVDGGFCDRANRKRSQSYVEDSRPSKRRQMRCLKALQ